MALSRDEEPSRHDAQPRRTSDVSISRDAYEAMVATCRAEYPAEVCGFIGARDGTLVLVIPVPNIAETHSGACGFLMESRAQFRAMRDMDDADLELGAIYHSHPNTSAVPSEADIRLAAYPDAAYLIVSCFDPDEPSVRAWQIANERVTELTVRLVPVV